MSPLPNIYPSKCVRLLSGLDLISGHIETHPLLSDLSLAPPSYRTASNFCLPGYSWSEISLSSLAPEADHCQPSALLDCFNNTVGS